MTPSRSACYKPGVARAPFDLYVFDLDGTLVDSRGDIAAAVNLARGDLGLGPLAPEEISGYIGEGVRRLMERAIDSDLHGQLESAIARFRFHYRDHLLDTTRPYPGVPALLETLAARGARMAVVSNKPRDFSEAILRGLSLLSHFDLVLGGDSLPERKPRPEPLLHVLAALGALPARALMVGDSRIDVLAARAAGLSVCAVTWGLEERATLEVLGPDYLVDRPEAVLAAGAAR